MKPDEEVWKTRQRFSRLELSRGKLIASIDSKRARRVLRENFNCFSQVRIKRSSGIISPRSSFLMSELLQPIIYG